MPSYKLYYFNVKARAETARMLFKLAGQDFEDVRVEREQWPELKKTMPMGQMPVLEVDGVQICQSNAINRYLAREFGFMGKDSLSSARVDMIVDSVEDITQKIAPIFQAQSEDDKAAAAKTFREETLEPALTKLETLLKQNKDGDGFFVGEDLTLADLAFLNVGGFAISLGKGDLSKFPKLKALQERIESKPKIAEWIKTRPETAM